MIERGYLGEVLEELRLERGLSLRDLAAQAGLTAGYLSALESGKQKNPSLEKLRGLAAALGVSITVVRDEPGYIRVSEGSPEDRSYVRSGVPTIREELDEAKEGAQHMFVPIDQLHHHIYRESLHLPPRHMVLCQDAVNGGEDRLAQTLELLNGADKQKTHYKPDWTSSPGDTIADILEERGLTPEDLAGRADLSVKYVEELLKGQAILTHEVAVGLQRALGSTVKFWMAREFHYRKALAEKVVIGVDHGAGPDRQVAQVWLVSEIGKYPPNFKELLSVGAADFKIGEVDLNYGPPDYVRFVCAGDEDDGLPHGVIHNSAGFRTGATRSSIAALPRAEQEDEPKLDPKKLIQEEVARMREDTARSMLKHLEEWKAIEAEMKRDPNLKAMFRRAPMYEAWKAGRADAAIDPNGGNLNPHEKAVAERLLAELEAYKPLPRADAPQPDSDGTAPLGEE